MLRILRLIQNDIRHIVRDRMLKFFLFMPILIILAVTYGVPPIVDLYPFIAEYQLYIMMSAGLQTAIMFGFVYSFLILEEKDEKVLQAIRILPISTFSFVLIRMLFATVLSFVGAFVTIYFCGLAYPGLLNTFLLSVLYGLSAPAMALIVATFANNKVEGMAWFKGVNLVVILPILPFFLPITKYLFMWVPTYWTYHFYEVSMEEGKVGLAFMLAMLFYLLVLGICYQQFRKRVFER